MLDTAGRRPVGRELERVRHSGERVRPVCELPLEQLALQPRALPLGEVARTERPSSGSGDELASGEGAVERVELAQRTSFDQPSKTRWLKTRWRTWSRVAEPEQMSAEERAAS